MKKTIVIGFLVLSTSAYAQTVQEYSLKLNATELDLIGEGLGTQPFNKAAPLINKLRQQVAEQQQAAQKPVEEKKEEGK